MAAELILVNKNKKIKLDLIRRLGYKFTKNQIPLGSGTPPQYGILEIQNEDNKKEVSFCLLLNKRTMEAIVLPQPFHYYDIHTMRGLANFVVQMGLA